MAPGVQEPLLVSRAKEGRMNDMKRHLFCGFELHVHLCMMRNTFVRGQLVFENPNAETELNNSLDEDDIEDNRLRDEIHQQELDVDASYAGESEEEDSGTTDVSDIHNSICKGGGESTDIDVLTPVINDILAGIMYHICGYAFRKMIGLLTKQSGMGTLITSRLTLSYAQTQPRE